MRGGCKGPLMAMCLLVATGCTSGETGQGPDEDGDRTITVLAPSSMERTFDEIGSAFEDEHPGVTVDITYDATDRHLTDGSPDAPPDLIVGADRAGMDAASAAGLVATEPVFVAGNLLTVVTRPGEGAATYGEGRFASLDSVALCDSDSACGRITDSRLGGLIDDGELSGAPVSRFEDERATLAAVVDGAADAGVVYVTEALAAGDAVESFELGMDEQSPDTEVTIAVTEEARDPDLAQAFIDHLASDASLDTLSAAGFWVPGRGFG